MATTEFIDGNTLKRVRTMLKRGKEELLRDTACAGLALRVNKKGAVWLVASRDLKMRIGPIDLFTADEIPALRELVARVRQLRKEGRAPADLIAAYLKERDVALAAARTDVSHGIGESWEAVRDAFLAWVEKNRRPDTARGYRSSLGAVESGPIAKDFEPIHGKPVVSVTTKDLVRVRTNIVRRGGGEKLRQADLTVAALKSCFKWYINQESSLIETSPAESLGKVMERKKEDEEVDAETGRALSQDEIGLLIWGLAYCPNPAARLAVSLQLATGQRRMTVCRARKSQFIEHEEFGLVWRLPGSGEKTAAWRVLPLPDLARMTVENALGLTRPDNPYLFPQQRPRRTGASMDGHLSERRVSKVIEDMRKDGGPLAGLAFAPSTHDLRRTLITVMGPRMHTYTIDGRTLSRKDVEMITHADEGREGTASLVYDKSEYLAVKHAVLSEWQAWVMEGLERVAARMEAEAGCKSATKVHPFPNGTNA